MEELRFGALRVRGWSKGCELCWKGAKMVLFVTGICPLYNECFYCTISERRRGKDVIFADEVEVRASEDILREAELISAKGAGITGGEPTFVPERVVNYARMLKERFGNKFHIHLYTNGLMLRRYVKAFSEAGVDEIRLHSWDEKIWNVMREIKDMGMKAGAEMPAIPDLRYEEKLKRLAIELDRMDADFLNLNELEFSDSNRTNLLSLGFEPEKSSEVAVKGSREFAERILEFVERETGINGYFCPAIQKDYQMWMRWRRRSKKVALPFEIPTKDGTLIRVEVRNPPDRILKMAGSLAHVDGDRAFLPVEMLDELKGVEECYIVECAPTDDRMELARYPCKIFSGGSRGWRRSRRRL